ncbi:helix-turn-helix domain-containing protein [Enterococcus villorum]|uniref:helix-turn-helix domain-containing protein n=1 Tax=Enterococcus villorum TaxID=112904 RepID=UPI003F8B0DBA
MQTQEAVKKYLLKKKSVTKLDIFLFLSEHQFFITTHYLADYFSMSDSNFLLYIQELEQDFTALGLKEISLIKQKKFIQLDLGKIDIEKCYYELFGKYCLESTNFQILTALLKPSSTSMVSISQITNYSPSYLYSKMKSVNQFLALYGIAFKFSSKGRQIISGTEVQIQYCFLDVYWNIFSTTSFPYTKDTDQSMNYELTAYFKKSLLAALSGGMKEKLFLLLKICRENFPVTSLKTVQKELKEHKYIEYLIRPEFDLLHRHLPLCPEQRMLINILARLAISKLESDELSFHHYQTLLEENVPYIVYSKKLVEAFSESFHLSIPNNYQKIYALNFARNKLFSTFLNHDQPNTPLPTFALYEGKENFATLQRKIETFYLQFRQKNWEDFPKVLARENVQWIVEDLLHLYDRFKPQHSIVIGINYTKDFYVSKDLLVKIEQIFSSESVTIQKNYMDECDIVVSDCPLEHLPSHIKKIYLLDNYVTPQDWKNVITKIAEYIFELKQENDYTSSSLFFNER